MMTFRSAMEATGLRPRDIEPDGRFHRCPTDDKPRKRNGAYLLTVDGRRGYWRNFATETDWHSWTDGNATRAVPDHRIAERARQHRQQEALRRAAAIKDAREHFATLPRLLGTHPYLEKKGLSPRGCGDCRIDGELLAVPMRVGPSLVSIQTIATDGTKRYRTGCPTSGASLSIYRPGGTVTCLVEGFATGLAVYQAVPQARVVVCFDAGNLVKVAAEIKVSGLTVVCADNDWRSDVNTGLEKGKASAASIGCGIAYPTGIEGTDWADAMLEWGGPSKIRNAILREARHVA